MPSEWDALRDAMVERQLAARGIRDARVLQAMRQVPRELFVPPESRHLSCADQALAIDCEQTISQPYIVALMTEALELSGSERVLEIGTGCGYQTAVLATLVSQVYTVERHRALSEQASAKLERLGYGNVSFRVGDGSLGWPEEAPFDRVIITAAAETFPLPLWEQLVEGGIAVAPIGDSDKQSLTVLRKVGGECRASVLCACRFVPLISNEGGKGGE